MVSTRYNVNLIEGPPGTDGNIQVRFQSQIDGYDTDVNTLSQMERMGRYLPIFFHPRRWKIGSIKQSG